jgi:hypothetical protein
MFPLVNPVQPGAPRVMALLTLAAAAAAAAADSPRCTAMRDRAAGRLSIPHAQGRMSFAFAPIAHPALKPWCIVPIVQAFEQAGLVYLPPKTETRHVGPRAPLGRDLVVPTDWQTGQADVIVQYWRHPGDRPGPLPARIKAMDVLLQPNGHRLVWGIQNSTHVGGHKQHQYQALQRLAQAHGCSLNDLHLMPEQYLLGDADECSAFFAAYSEAPGADNTTWIVKDGSKDGGRGITLHHGAASVRTQFGPCPPPGSARPPPPSVEGDKWRDPLAASKLHSELIEPGAVLVQREVPSVLVPPEKTKNPNVVKKFHMR